MRIVESYSVVFKVIGVKAPRLDDRTESPHFVWIFPIEFLYSTFNFPPPRAHQLFPASRHANGQDLQEAKTSLTAPIPGRPAAATVADPTGSRTGMSFRAAAPRSGVADSATFPMVSSSGLVADPVHPLEGSEQPPLFVRFECEHFPGQSFSADEDTEVDSAHTVDIFSGMTSSSGGRGADGPVRGGHPHTLNPCPVDSNNKLSSALRRYPAAAPPGFVDAGGGHEVVSGTTVLRVVATTVPTVNFRETEAPDEVAVAVHTIRF